MRVHELTWAAALTSLFAGFALVTASSATSEVKGNVTPLAEVDGQIISVDDVDNAIGEPVRKLEEQVANLRRAKVQAIINDRLLAAEAARRGVSVQALLDAEVTSKVGLVTEQEIERIYQSTKRQAEGDEAAERDQLRTRLQNEKLAVQRRAFVESLRARSKVVIHIPAPTVNRVQVTTDGGPAKGPTDASVTIVKFEDFHCPFCKRVQARFEELRSRYPGQIRLVHRDFPLDSLHPAARRAHEAARCADDQNKFWEYHDIVYSNAPKASTVQLQEYAKQAGLDVPIFNQCLESGKHKTAVERDVTEGKRFGVTGTPHFFINGRPLVGAQPMGKFVELIEAELALRSR